MILEKIESVKLDAPFAEKKVDVNHGDFVKILADVMKQPDRFNPGKMQTIVKIQTKNGARYVSLNQTSINILINEFGTNDAANWVGRQAKALIKPGVFAGKKGYALYLTGPEWEFDEYGSPVKGTDGNQDIPVVGEDINADEVPFN